MGGETIRVTSLEEHAWRLFIEKIDPQPNPYRTDPAGWVEDRLHETVWSKQQTILQSLVDHRRTIVHSCNSAGKSYIASRAGCWWLDTRPLGQAWLVSTAATWDQVRSVLWQEIGKAHRKGKLPGRVNQTEWWDGDTMLGYGRKPPDQDATGFFGAHRTAGVLVIVDEASGITDSLWEAIARSTTGDHDRILAIGNPDYEGSPFHRRCMNDGWHTVHIDGLETPRFTGEPVPPESSLLSQSSIDEVVRDYGEDSPLYLSMVRGLFPADRTDGVLPWSLLHASRGPSATEKVGPLRLPVELGVDVGGGQDLTVIYPRHGPRAGVPLRQSTTDGEEIVGHVIGMVREHEATAIKIDFGGIGFGVSSSLRVRLRREVSWPVEVHDITFGAGAGDSGRFVNARAELWWNGRELARAGRWDLSECDERTLADLAAPRWFETKNNRIQIEEKDQVRRRLGRSPDDGDALLLAFYTPPTGEIPVPQPYRDARLRGRR